MVGGLIVGAEITDMGFVDHLLFRCAAETLRIIARDPKHLGADIGFTLVLHTWGSALTHHPHVHGIVAGGGFSLDGQQWVACKPGFFLPVRVLSRLFRRLFLGALARAHRAGELSFYNDHSSLTDPQAFADWLIPLRRQEWVVYAKRPFAGPQAVLAYLSRYTHRVAIANSRLIRFDEQGVTFKWKDYRAKGRTRQKTMTLDCSEFIRRFLIHVLPHGFHRIRHYGWMANATRVEKLTQARECLRVKPANASCDASEDCRAEPSSPWVCPTCAAPMIVIGVVECGHRPRAPPAEGNQ